MKISFHGAARSVTGSRHLIEVGGRRILLDCGLVQGRREEAYHRNVDLGFAAKDVDAVVLSHAHIDHSGALPALVKHGFTGRIHATAATTDLADVMLRDSAFIQEKDVEIVNRREKREGTKARKPAYTMADAEQAVKQFKGWPYRKPFPVVDGVTAEFLEAGHILGAAIVRLTVEEGGRKHVVVFSGDLGRECLPIVRKPDIVETADTLLIESTYGNREHEPVENVENEFADLVTRVVGRQGKIIIPAFAVGRTQAITYMLNNLSNQKRIPDVPVYVDSPLASEATEVFRRHPDCWDEKMVQSLREARDSDPFGFRLLRYTRTADESKKLNDLNGPAIIISASGMCESGRVLHHLANHLGNPRNVLLLVGYQAEGTLGRRLLEGQSPVFILGRPVDRRATVMKMNALSAHAGKSELHAWIGRFQNRVRNLFIVHGEPAQSEPFAEWARQNTSARVVVPGLNDAHEL